MDPERSEFRTAVEAGAYGADPWLYLQSPDPLIHIVAEALVARGRKFDEHRRHELVAKISEIFG